MFRLQLISVWRQGRGPGHDSSFLKGLGRNARRYTRHEHALRCWMMITDARFDRQQVQEGNLNPPGRRHGKLVSPEREARSELVAAAGLDGIYGQRWKCETVHSAIKRKFGDVVRSRQASAPRHDPAVKGSVYNAHVP
jgi:hypothetical protein